MFTDFTAGHVIVTLYSKGLVKGSACLQYYTIMEDIAHFLQQAVDPVKFMCQVSTCHLNFNPHAQTNCLQIQFSASALKYANFSSFLNVNLM